MVKKRKRRRDPRDVHVPIWVDLRHWAAANEALEGLEKKLADGRRRGTDRMRESRKRKNIERDQRILALSTSGKAPKQIAAEENLSVSQVNRILQREKCARA
jgi:DNA-binding CsgD family transcriptional regulator